jgi:uncharacterized RDD family membrane protein YckC
MSVSSTRVRRKTAIQMVNRVGTSPVATRQDRLKAAGIDAACLLAAFLPYCLILYILGAWKYYWLGVGLGAAGSAVIFALLNYSLLESDGQTIGKRAMKIRIIGRDNQPLTVTDILMKRYAPLWLISLVPVVGPLLCLADLLCILRPSHACAHDDLAQTKVVPV